MTIISFPFFCSAQKQKKEKKDTVTVKDFVPSGIRIGTDVLALIMTSVDDSYSGWEVNADVDLHRYFLTLDVGNWGRNYHSITDSSSHDYSNKGNYLRIGADFNFLPKDPNENVLFFGARYARGTFSENYVVHTTDEIWGPIDQTFANDDISARWFELTGGLRVRVWKVFWLGYTARYKFGLKTGDTPVMLPHDIPGYGRTDKNNTWGFNYLVLVKIPFRNKNFKSPK